MKLNKYTQRCALLLTFIQTGLCSSLQLWIAVLTRRADSMWQLVISRQCTSKHDLCVALKVPLSDCCRSTAAPCSVCGPPWRPGVYRKVTDSCGCRVRVWTQPHTNETLLCVSHLLHPTKWKMCVLVCVKKRESGNYRSGSVCGIHADANLICLVWECVTSVYVCVVKGGGIYSCYILWQRFDSVRLGLCRQCG